MFSGIEYKTDAQIRLIRRAALVVAAQHQALRAAVQVGMTTRELDEVAHQVITQANAKSNFYGYYDYPAQICISVNEEIVHGIPGDRVLNAGDIVSFDCGAVLDGWHGDAAFTVVLPGGDPTVQAQRQQLSRVTEEAMWHGIAAMATGKRVGDIGAAMDDYLMTLPEEQRPDVVLDYVGHGIGSQMHQPPDVVNYHLDGRTPKLKPGMVLCIEPMLVMGNQENRVLADDWTVVTRDGSDAAHWEHEVALHKNGIWVLTAPDGGKAGLAPFGITPVPLD
ncbi:MAG: type I methionyl aminopeptidase [Trueperella sp.]|nr:type I methionyl aminopeptidase [Trueperella sp.]